MSEAKDSALRAALEYVTSMEGSISAPHHSLVKQIRSALAMKPSPHPWQAFLEARANAIDWMHADGKSDHVIAEQLSMDGARQVFLIRTRERPSTTGRAAK